MLLKPRDFARTDASPILPDTALVPDFSSIRVGYYGGTPPSITLENQLDDIVGHVNGLSIVSKTVNLTEPYQQIECVSDQASRRWMVGAASPKTNRTYAFVPTAGQQASANQALTWTYNELVAGKTNDLFTLSADNGGTRLTALKSFICNASHGYLIDAELVGNNSDTAWILDTSASVLTAGFLPAVQNAFAHSRGETFRISQQMQGPLMMSVNDWIRIDYSLIGTDDDSSIASGVMYFERVQELQPQ